MRLRACNVIGLCADDMTQHVGLEHFGDLSGEYRGGSWGGGTSTGSGEGSHSCPKGTGAGPPRACPWCRRRLTYCGISLRKLALVTMGKHGQL
jgi:hypothetical protein